MARKSTAQLNIRSTAARQRVDQLVRQTGKTVTQIVEDAVRAYRPPLPAERSPAPQGLEWKGRLLVVKPSGGPEITLEDTNRWIEDDRNRDLFGD